MFSEKYIGKLIVANIKFGGVATASLIVPRKIKSDDLVEFYWRDGPTRAQARFVAGSRELADGEATVVHVYGLIKDDEWWTAVELHYLRTFHPITPCNPPLADENGAYMGWISPTGDYYVASYGNHDGAACCIAASVLNRRIWGYEARELLFNTWIVVRQGGMGDLFISGHEGKLTVSQLRVVGDIERLSGLPCSGKAFRSVIDDTAVAPVLVPPPNKKQVITPKLDCRYCHGTGEVYDSVPYGSGGAMLPSFCGCVEEQADEDTDEIVLSPAFAVVNSSLYDTGQP